MAGKRRATSELNRDNWDQDEPAEESGVYNKASEEVLKKRVFKTAKRRIPKPPEEASINAFSQASLANLTSKSHQPANQLFSFLSNMKPDATKTNGVGSKPNNQGDGKAESPSLFSFGNKTEKSETSTTFGKKAEESSQSSSSTFSFVGNTSKASASTPPTFIFGNTGNTSLNQATKIEETVVRNEKSHDSTEHYYARLKGLNESVAKWINKHVEDNPLIDLQPIFKDYEKFFNEIEKEHKKVDVKNDTVKAAPILKPPETTAASMFKFGTPAAEKNLSSNKTEPSSTPTFQFSGTSSTSNKTPSEKVEASFPASTFKFGANVSSNKTDQGSFKFDASSTSKVPSTESGPKFSFGDSSGGFSGFTFTPNPVTSSSAPKINFGSVPPPNNEEKDEEESEEPPKVEVKEVEEEGHIYTIKCKVFVKKDGTFVEKGVGSLFLKPVPDSEKLQVIVRAHNSLANVLCNFIVSKSIPTQRVGKNNVMFVCIPTPDSKPPPIPILIKVKTSEDADQLFGTIEKHKQ